MYQINIKHIILLFMISSAFALSLIFSAVNEYHLIHHGNKTIGVITAFEFHYGRHRRRFYKTTVKFQDTKGMSHTKVSDEGVSTLTVGERINVYYDKNNPDNFVLGFGLNSNLFYAVLSSMLAIMFFAYICKRIKYNRNKNRCIGRGVKLIATVVAINKVFNSSKTYRNIVKLTCKYEECGRCFLFISETLYSCVILPSIGSKIDVYVMADNYEKYHVDVSEYSKPENNSIEIEKAASRKTSRNALMKRIKIYFVVLIAILLCVYLWTFIANSSAL